MAIVTLLADFQNFEDPMHPRQTWAIRIGNMHQRRYLIPREDSTTLLPSRGDAVTLRDIAAPAVPVLSPRVYANPVIRPRDSATLEVTITFIEPVAYS